jgi:CDGSH-type Zn-finger protein
MEKPVIAQKSPYVLEMQPGNYYYCSCGKSSKQPFCDGSHRGSEFVPKKVEITDIKKVAWCGCKHSSNAPFCDGTHAKL